MRRYFMTIPEAVQLVLQAYVMGSGEEVFCLDMGEPVRIVDLARDLIALTAGPGKPEVDIRFVGTRPGEKLFEEMFFDSEHAQPTSHPKVLRSIGTQMDQQLTIDLALRIPQLYGSPSDEELIELIHALVEEYRVEIVGSG
jgi:FlaA1/EpsC-like NDP-sugar epimerase